MSTEAYPLAWPTGWKRLSDNLYRDHGQFQVSLAVARDDLIAEIQRLVGRYRDPQIVLSSNLQLRRDGLPYANQREPEDPGVAVYFAYKDSQRVFACDQYVKVAHNMRAIGLTIAALRGIERWGASDMLERAFTGFEALPNLAKEPWWVVLKVHEHAQMTDIELSYRTLRSANHPDKGGDAEQFDRIQKAYEAAKAATSQ